MHIIYFRPCNVPFDRIIINLFLENTGQRKYDLKHQLSHRTRQRINDAIDQEDKLSVMAGCFLLNQILREEAGILW